ncbi:ParB/RepB/Spo0J family partition protein [Saccharopolyspora sp. NPDC047091]|uniref:ParB/RepB/Spo0J family partition protein n=1 Tax=Saccharopolyspora sp. NPDC047091 TaxID=3155924 RepID=UPI0033FF2FD3
MTTTEPDTQEVPGAEASEAQLLRVDPNELIIGVNVRANAVLGSGFVADIKRRGVREPVTVVRRGDGALVVCKGQRRVLAAIKAEQPTVPALLLDEAEDTDAKSRIARVIDQLGENEHREQITDRDELAATQELLDLGLTARQIARERSIPRKRVEGTVVVARSDAARHAVLDTGMDLLQAAALAEFDGDEEAMAELRTTAAEQPHQLDHVAQRWRDQRAEDAALAARSAELAEQGVTVIERPYLYPNGLRRLSMLRPTPESEPGNEIDPDQHRHCPGHAVFLDYSRATGQVHDVGVCSDFPAHGHAERFAPAGQATSAPSNGAALTERERAAKTAYRRTVIAHGKSWDSATTLRRDWLRTFAARRTAPKDAPVWTAQVWASGAHCLRKALESGHELAGELLGLPGGPAEIARAAANATPGRATVILTVLALAAIEVSTDRRRTWERPDELQRGYFAQIQQWGYEPADVEALVTDEAPSNTGDIGDAAELGEAA